MRLRDAIHACSLLALAGLAGAAPDVRVEASGSVLAITPSGPCEGYEVSLSGPEGYFERRSFEDCGAQQVELSRAGQKLADGTYGYEVRLSGAATREPQASGALQVQAGSAEVVRTLLLRAPAEPPPGREDVVFADDLIAQRACIGNTCADGEPFGVATFKVKGTVPWLQFETSSPTAHDWVLAADAGFALSDLSTLLTPLSVAAGAPSNSLVVDASGRVGIGTAAPFAELTLLDPGSPYGIAFHSPGSGSGSETWRAQVNGGYFQLGRHDVPGMFRGMEIESATGNALFADNGHVVPQASLHVRRTDGTARLLVEESNPTATGRNLLRLVNNGPPTFRFDNTSNGTGWGFGQIVSGNRFFVSAVGASGLSMTLDGTGNMVIGGLLTQMSDRNSKTDVEPLDGQDVLERVAALSVASWRYKTDEARHVGPMAQDFAAAFGLGDDETHVAPSDVAGVGLVAVQALYERLRAAEARGLELERGNRELHERLSALAAALEARQP